MPDPLEMAEGTEALDSLINQAPPKIKSSSPTDIKADWQQINVRMDPAIRRRLKKQAETLRVPFEELLHEALSRFLDDLENGEELKLKTVATRRTIL